MDISTRILVALFMLIFGLVVGVKVSEVVEADDCQNYGKHVEGEWLMVCTKIVPLKGV